MSTIDLSRHTTNSAQHYSGVRMQQGRVLTDHDFNDAAALDAEQLRTLRLQTIGAYGSPDQGFLPKQFAVVAGKPTFTLSAGNLILGGLPLSMAFDQPLHLQKNWLNFNPAVELPNAPAAGQSRIDLIWIEAWEQAISAIEDRELLEVALGGPDTTVRMRVQHRVHILPNIGQTECSNAWRAAQAEASFANLGNINAQFELETNTRLRVTYTAPAVPNDLCSPAMAGGYLGAENQAIRVQLTSANTYTWGYNNASPLYRVQVGMQNGQRVRITLLTEPKDATRWAMQNQVVEILPWSAALANGERTAEHFGHISKVATSYNPDTKTLELATPLAADFGEFWKTRADANTFFDGTAAESFFYMRVWDRGDDIASPAHIPIANTNLGNTGLAIGFTGGPLRTGDYWVIAARPQAPDAVTPWLLESVNGSPAHGVQRFRAPIGLVQWSTDANGNVTGTLIHDCRPPFLPLTKIRNCCSVTVGDGTDSFGQYQSINAAIAALPPSGGTVCVLPGRYLESIVLNLRNNITIHGCGPRSQVFAQTINNQAQPAIQITHCQHITVEGLTLIGGPVATVHCDHSQAIRIAENCIAMRDEPNPANSANAAAAPVQTSSQWPAVWLEGQCIEVERNSIVILPTPTPSNPFTAPTHHTHSKANIVMANRARGGIQVAGGSQGIRIEHNLILGGMGNGITLGHLIQIDPQNPNGIDVPDVFIIDLCAPCDPIDNTTPGNNPDPNNPANTPTYRSAGALYDIHIHGNHIAAQGGNGIGVVRYFGVSSSAAGAGNSTQNSKNTLELIAVHGLSIIDNTITQCLRRNVAPVSESLRYFVGYGGIALALCSALNIAHNTITDNGIDWRTPVCGVFALMVDGLHIEHNTIAHNGVAASEPIKNTQQGLRAGVHIWMAMSAANPIQAPNASAAANSSFLKNSHSPVVMDAMRIQDNHIDQPLGRALFILGMGPMHITGNRLLSRGAGAPATDPFANTLVLGNFGISREWTLGLIMTLVYQLLVSKENTETQQQICLLSNFSRFMPGLNTRLPSGKLLFQHNQVSFLSQEETLGFDLCSSLLFSLDDASIGNNQFEHHAQQRIVFSQVLAAAPSVRLHDNRLAETWGRAFTSGISLGLMNNTGDNQSTHCLKAYGLQRAVHDNLALSETFCPDTCGGYNPFEAVALAFAAVAGRP